jgi:hypothetical protein
MRTIETTDLPKAIALAIIVICGFVSGCRGSQTVWSAEARSPDGKMIATARAVANGGFGISGVPATFVDLNWTAGSQAPKEILEIGNESDSPSDMKVEMNWLGPNQLELRYNGKRQTVEFQAVNFAGVGISLRDLSKESVGSPK